MLFILLVLICAVSLALAPFSNRGHVALVAVCCAIFLVPSSAKTAAKTMIIGDAEADGFKIGMTKAKIDRARKDVKYGEDINGDGACIQAEVKNQPITLMLEKNVLTRIYFNGPTYATGKNIHIGSPEKAAIAAYGKALIVETHHYDEQGHYLTLLGKKGIALRFETDGKVINGITIGTKAAIEYVEGCL